jgi:uncharacterized protein (DUF779 family)
VTTGTGRDRPLPAVTAPQPPRVAVTAAATAVLRALYAANGPLMFHQSGGCCDGSSPMCYLAGEFRTGTSDVLLASLRIDGVPEPVTFWMSAAQFERGGTPTSPSTWCPAGAAASPSKPLKASGSSSAPGC